MKDKLKKNNHHTLYYLGRKVALSFAIFASLGAAIAIPTTLNVLTSEPKTLKAEEAQKVDNSEEDPLSLASYSSLN